MTRYLIEVPHASSKFACKQAVSAFMATGSHFMTNADWGCADDVHKAWFIGALETKGRALSLLPPLLRQEALVITLQQFDPQDIEEILEHHPE